MEQGNLLRGKGLIIVPIYNEERSLQNVHEELSKRTSECEVIFVNDGSRDGTRTLLNSLRCRTIHHPINLGYLEAIRTGINVAIGEGYEFCVFFDGDGQHRIEDLDSLVQHHFEFPEFDVLVGSRYLSGQQAANFLRHIVGLLGGGLINACGAWFVRSINGLDRRDRANLRAHLDFIDRYYLFSI